MFNCAPNGFVWLWAARWNFGGEDRSGHLVPSGPEPFSISDKHLGHRQTSPAGELGHSLASCLGLFLQVATSHTAAGAARITEDSRDGRCQLPSAVKLKDSDTAHSLSCGNGGASQERNGWLTKQGKPNGPHPRALILKTLGPCSVPATEFSVFNTLIFLILMYTYSLNP